MDSIPLQLASIVKRTFWVPSWISFFITSIYRKALELPQEMLPTHFSNGFVKEIVKALSILNFALCGSSPAYTHVVDSSL
nr:hypothetical transcript [Hymenolepis microstoma]